MPSKVFISYRRDDSKWQAREIYGALKRVLPPDHLFMDTEDIPPGIDFVEYLEGWVDQCDIMLVLIGPGWADAVDPETGRRRLENPMTSFASKFARVLLVAYRSCRSCLMVHDHRAPLSCLTIWCGSHVAMPSLSTTAQSILTLIG